MNISPISYQSNVNINSAKCANTNFKSSKAMYDAFRKRFPDEVPGKFAAINLDKCPVSGMTWGQQLGMRFVGPNHGLSIGKLTVDNETYEIIPVKDIYSYVCNYINGEPRLAQAGYDLTGTTYQITNG